MNTYARILLLATAAFALTACKQEHLFEVQPNGKIYTVVKPGDTIKWSQGISFNHGVTPCADGAANDVKSCAMGGADGSLYLYSCRRALPSV